MAREIDEVFIEEAIARYQRIDERNAEFAKASAGMEVTVHSPDGPSPSWWRWTARSGISISTIIYSDRPAWTSRDRSGSR